MLPPFSITLLGFSQSLGQRLCPGLVPPVKSLDLVRFPPESPRANTLPRRTLLGIVYHDCPWEDSAPERGVGQLMSGYAHHNP